MCEWEGGGAGGPGVLVKKASRKLLKKQNKLNKNK